MPQTALKVMLLHMPGGAGKAHRSPVLKCVLHRAPHGDTGSLHKDAHSISNSLELECLRNSPEYSVRRGPHGHTLRNDEFKLLRNSRMNTKCQS